MAKSNIRMCRYAQCNHSTKEINLDVDEYTQKGKIYYHKDCYKAKIKGEWKDEKTKQDLQTIKNLWIEHINDTVIYSQLFQMLNGFLQRGVESEYLLFVLQYCILHKYKLQYPGGFKYYVDRQEIKDAYARTKIAKMRQSPLPKIADSEEISPKFSISSKPKGFSSIFKKDK